AGTGGGGKRGRGRGEQGDEGGLQCAFHDVLHAKGWQSALNVWWLFCDWFAIDLIESEDRARFFGGGEKDVKLLKLFE
ncbi:MAG: hypothetical protein R6W66_01845, partial [Pelovirga sp.]